jgi:hypothetical protein
MKIFWPLAHCGLIALSVYAATTSLDGPFYLPPWTWLVVAAFGALGVVLETRPDSLPTPTQQGE